MSIPNVLKELGSRIRQERLAQNLTQEDLADLSNLDRSYIGSIERGKRNISFLVFCEIARALHKDIAFFTHNLPL